MDLHSQEAIANLAEEHGKDNIIVLLGAPDPEAAEIAAETVIEGDPAWAGPLAGAQLGLEVFHVLDERVKEAVPDDVWEDQIGVMSDVLEADELVDAVKKMREKFLNNGSGSDEGEGGSADASAEGDASDSEADEDDSDGEDDDSDDDAD